MARPVIPASRVSTLGPWLVRGKAGPSAAPETAMLGVEPATDDQPGGWSYFIRQARASTPGETSLPLAVGIQRLADAKLMAAAPEITDVLLRLLIAPALGRRDLDPTTRSARDAAWDLLVRVAPHLKI